EWGYPSRGDFNYGFEWWLRPVYVQFTRYASSYYGQYASHPDFDRAGYTDHMKSAMVRYHKLTRCNFGKNGKDLQSKDDDQAMVVERQAGITLTTNDIVQ